MMQLKFKQQGQNLVEIAIILTVIVIAGVVVLTFLGFNVNNLFTSSHTKYKEFKPFEWGNNDSGAYAPIKAGDLKGTESKPVSKCSGGMCSIDYGEFVLNGIPENFNDFVQTGGTSGGQDKLVELILQIAQQLEDNGDAAGAKQFRDLANLNHFIANIEKETENMAESCKAQVDPTGCWYQKLQSPNTLALPNNITNLLPNFKTEPNFQLFFSVNFPLGNCRKNWLISNNDPSSTTQYPSYQILKIYDDIQKNPKYSSTLKGVTTDLIKQIDTMSTSLYAKTQANLNGIYGEFDNKMTYYDIVTGAELYTSQITGDGLTDIINPKYNLKTDLRAQLICVNGRNNDTGHACN